PHVLQRACDVMRTDFPTTQADEPIRAAGFAMARAELDLTPIVDRAGALVGVVTVRTLARRFIRETRQTSNLKEAPTLVSAVVDAERRPVGLITRSDLVAPPRRRVLLVDHAEQAQSAPGVEQAEIVEILDHHHIGSIETRVPVTATFDPVGSTATLVIERFRNNGMEPSRTAAIMLLGGILSDTVILNSPTTTDRDRTAVDYLERVLALDVTEF